MSDVAILFSLIAAGVLTFILGGVALVLLQRAIARHMAASSGGPPASAADGPRRAADVPLILTVDNAPAAAPGLSDRILWRIAAAQVAAGLTFAIVAGFILLLVSGKELLPILAAAVIVAFAWPTVIVLNLLAGPDRRMQGLVLLGYLGGVLALSGVAVRVGVPGHEVAGITLPGQPLFLWVIYALPSLFLLLFLNRTIRTIGPLVLVFVFVLLLGGNIAQAIVVLPSVRDSLPNFLLVYTIDGMNVVAGGLGMLAAAWPAWRLAALLRDRYSAKRTSELLLTVWAIWLLQSLVLANFLFAAKGLPGAAAAVVPVLAWRLALHLGLRPVLAAARTRPPSRLLLLRVFGFGRRTRRLLDLLGARWRLIGSIDLIAAPDLASRTVEPSTFIEFIRGRLARLFIRTPGELKERLATLDNEPDPDARFRINQLFCSDDMWREAVTRLMGEASLVAMDLRGFGADRRGCVFELQTLLDTVPLDRLVLLFDKTTDLKALESLIGERWQQLSTDSPNLALRNPTLQLIDASGSDVLVVRRLLTIAEAPASAVVAPPQ